MEFAFISLILLINIQAKCEPQNICALREASVLLRCFYSNINITTVFWFSQKQRTNWRNKDEPEDLTLDSDYSGRVDQWINEDYSELKIYNLTERDSGEYQLMIIMKDGVKHLSSVTVNLTVTVLQVKIHQESTELKNQKVRLTCDTSCTLPSRPKHIYWRKDGQHLKKPESNILKTLMSSAAYSCFLSKEIFSAPVCLSNSSCWGVTYTSRRVCALVGSTVDIHSSYSHPTGDTVEKSYWHLPYNTISEYQDMREEHQFAGRVEYMNNTLRIKDVNMRDSGEYRFRIITNTNSYSGSPGVILTVTGTKVRSSPDPVIDGEKVILSCLTRCTLDNKHTYIWYKNGQQVTDGLRLLNKLYLDSINSEEIKQFSCTVRETLDSSVFVLLLVFLPQFLIIGALWMWFFISMNKFKSKNKTDDKQIEILQVCE